MKAATERYDDVLYAELSESQRGQAAHAVRVRKHQRWVGIFSFVAGSLITLVLTGLAVTLRARLVIPKTWDQLDAETLAADWNYCGRSAAVAKKRGCVLEPMFYGWMPPQCVFPEFSRQYPIFDDRVYYADFNMTVVLSQDQLYAGVHNPVYVMRYHDEHCLFQWRKLQYAMHNRLPYVDNKTIDMGHSKHCADSIATLPEPVEGVRNTVELGFYRCRKTPW